MLGAGRVHQGAGALRPDPWAFRSSNLRPDPPHSRPGHYGRSTSLCWLWPSPNNVRRPLKAEESCCCLVTSVVSNSVWPHRRHPIRLPCPWDSPGKNTAVGCHFLLQSMKVKSQSEVAQSCPTLRDPMDCSQPGSSIHGIFQARVLEWGAIAFSRRKQIRLQNQAGNK